MKLTKRQLKRIIKEATAGGGAELTDPNVTDQDVSSQWPEGVTYRGQNVFETFYSDSAMAAADAFVLEAGYTDGQENYLGYDPVSDAFYMAYDTWTDEVDMYGDLIDTEMSSIMIELDPDEGPMEIIGTIPGGFYPRGYDMTKRRFPHIIDVRLD